MAAKIVEQLEEEGVITHTQAKVNNVKLLEDGKKQVELEINGKQKTITVDTILVAIGRDCDPASM
jgi:thioredoxin reductase (NADPH)